MLSNREGERSHQSSPVCKYKLCGITTAPSIPIISKVSSSSVCIISVVAPLTNATKSVPTIPHAMNKAIESVKTKNIEITGQKKNADCVFGETSV